MMVYALDPHPVGGHYPKVDWGEPDFPTAPVLDDFDDGLPNQMGPKAGVPVYGGVLPKVVRWDESAGNPPPDFDNMPELNVSDRARQVIESVEPGVHQFFPVEYIDRHDRVIETRYWFFICNRRDTIHPTASNMAVTDWGAYVSPHVAVRMKMTLPPHVDAKLPAKFMIDRAKLGDAHVWREPRADGMRLMSETMWEAIQHTELTGLRLSPIGVV